MVNKVKAAMNIKISTGDGGSLSPSSCTSLGSHSRIGGFGRSPALSSPRKKRSFSPCHSIPMYCCVLLIGYVVGFLHGRVLSVSSSDAEAPELMKSLTSVSSSLVSSTKTVWQGKEHNQGSSDGWKSIHVYYGTRNHLIKQPAEDIVNTKEEQAEYSQQERHALESNITDNETTRTWYSQARQDEIIVALLDGKTSGYYVDLAANDATHWSNTYALEEGYGWDGLCIEPNPIYWKNLSYRSCTVVAAVVGGATRQDDIYFRYNAGTHGGIADEGFDNNRRWQRESQHESTVSLTEVFSKAQVPRQIDYLSLDVEGAETLILTNFPLSLYKVQIITAERLKGPVRAYLKQHGYEFIKRVTRWGESLWIHNESLPHVNLKALDQFSFPIV